MRLFKLSLLFILLAAGPLNAADNDSLEPPMGFFTGPEVVRNYYHQVDRILLTNSPAMPIVRVIKLPSFSSEEVVAVVEDGGGGYVVEHRKSSQQIWANKYLSKIKVIKNIKKIDTQTADLIKDVFVHSINDVKYPKEQNYGLDGTSYFFITGVRIGSTWEPRQGTLPAHLVELSELLIKYVKANDKESSTILQLINEKLKECGN